MMQPVTIEESLSGFGEVNWTEMSKNIADDVLGFAAKMFGTPGSTPAATGTGTGYTQAQLDAAKAASDKAVAEAAKAKSSNTMLYFGGAALLALGTFMLLRK